MSENSIKEPAADCDVNYTYSDYLTFDFEYRVELIRGKIFKMSPAPSLGSGGQPTLYNYSPLS